MSSICFSVFSDIHCLAHDEWPNGAFPKLLRAFDLHENRLPRSDAYLFTGDTFYQLDKDSGTCTQIKEGAYERFFEIYRENVGDRPALFVMGNHEYPQHIDDFEMNRQSREVFMRHTGMPLRFHQTIGGYHFIGASALSYYIPQNDETENFIRTEVEAALKDAPLKPVFILLHAPLMRFYGESDEIPYSKAFSDFLKRTPEAVVITGHTHELNEDDHCIRRNGYTEINCPVFSIGGADFPARAEGFTNDFGTVFELTETLLFEVKDSEVSVTTYDNVSGESVNRWVFDIRDRGLPGSAYTKEEQIARKPPEFAPDATVTVEGNEVVIKQSFMPYQYCIQYYTLVFKNRESNEATVVSYPRDFFRREKAEYLRKPIPTLPSGEYDCRLYVSNSFGTRCLSPLTFHLKV